MLFRTIILLIFLLHLPNCSSDPAAEKRRKDNQRQSLMSLIANQNLKADCVYCTNTQAFQGNCSCYVDIPVGTCQGISTGTGKSNSYKISCSDLTSTGIWTTDGGGNSSCTFLTCPPEAYRAAFTSNGR
ncbi:hypothetical protein LEP1GSC058_0091 [Leptospira fainei serovar Hurstbridge str. BUT 6]|uniref:Lipoprotein n=1 Tax=Leptospira fainei serovar Hurstbridge str. BUT 6 TaxID=1193011 RepID=S3V154_9LEPT|nr:hypothetical protein [Leptospira fainei]EPG75178.1 hypothetical protein LEP1GSC058_0091 [Leptospira fainei serovar Hurstbridge str. BUT 6]